MKKSKIKNKKKVELWNRVYNLCPETGNPFIIEWSLRKKNKNENFKIWGLKKSKSKQSKLKTSMLKCKILSRIYVQRDAFQLNDRWKRKSTEISTEIFQNLKFAHKSNRWKPKSKNYFCNHVLLSQIPSVQEMRDKTKLFTHATDEGEIIK